MLFSRVTKLGDITFIGDAETTVNAIESLLKQKSPWDEYIQRLTETSANREHVQLPAFQLSPFRARRIQLPSTANGYVFLLISTWQPPLIFADQSENLQQSLYDHNTGKGCAETALPQRQPWGVLHFATGFSDNPETNKCERLALL